MPITATFQRTFQVAGLSFNTSRQVQSDLATPFSVSVPAAKTGAITTRTDNTTGTLTMSAGHGFTTGARLDVYWTNPDGSQGSRRGVTAGTVATNSVPFSGGAGDNLPALVAGSYTITAMAPVVETVTVPGANLAALAFSAPAGGIAVFARADNTELYASVRTPQNPSDVVVVADGTNPIGSGNTVGKVFLSHPNSAAAQTLTGTTQYS